MNRIILSLIVIKLLITNVYSQNLLNDYKQDDYKAALELLGVNIYKFSFENIKDNYDIKIIVDEVTPDSIIFSKQFHFNPFKIEETQFNEIKIISKRESYTSETLWLKIMHPNQHTLARFDINEIYRVSHLWREFKEGELEYEKKVPILLYGTAWEVEYPNGVKLMKFCPNELKRDLSNEELKKMKHYFIISYELTKH